jgi:hypothetical protein
MTRTRLARRTSTTQNGTRVVTTKLVEAGPLEWRLQAAGIRALRAMPEFGKQFDFEGDFNAARRSPHEAVKAKATGLTAGAFDVRIYMHGGRLGLIEVKAAKGRLSPEQKTRHADLLRLGFTNQTVIKVATESEAAERFVSTVRGWLAANDNQQQRAA